MNAYTIFDDYPAEAAEILRNAGVSFTVHPRGMPRPDAAQMKEILEAYDCVIIGTTQKITEDMFEHIDSPRVIATASVGVDHIRVPEDKRHLVTVFNTPAANTPSVAEYNVGAMLMARRRLAEGDRLYAQGRTNKQLVRKPQELRGTTVGFVGAGRITTQTMALLKPFGVSFLCHTDDAPQRQHLVSEYGVRFVSLRELAETADIISVNVPALPSTAGLINAEIIGAMKEDCIFVSIARESVLDIPALLKKAENCPAFYVMLDLDVLPDCVGANNGRNIVITPHIAGGTVEARRRMFLETAGYVADYRMHHTA